MSDDENRQSTWAHLLDDLREVLKFPPEYDDYYNIQLATIGDAGLRIAVYDKPQYFHIQLRKRQEYAVATDSSLVPLTAIPLFIGQPVIVGMPLASGSPYQVIGVLYKPWVTFPQMTVKIGRAKRS